MGVKSKGIRKMRNLLLDNVGCLQSKNLKFNLGYFHFLCIKFVDLPKDWNYNHYLYEIKDNVITMKPDNTMYPMYLYFDEDETRKMS